MDDRKGTSHEDSASQQADDANLHDDENIPKPSSSKIMFALKLLSASALLVSAASNYSNGHEESVGEVAASGASPERRRRLSLIGESVPTYMEPMMDDLKERKKLMEETPKEEIKYWFEYAGPLQKYYYRYSKSRGKADSFEGRDDSGVVSSRFVEEAGGGDEHKSFYSLSTFPPEESSQRARLLENCLSMGSPMRPNTAKGSIWNDWFGGKGKIDDTSDAQDRCRILITMNTVGAGRGTTMLWETNPPAIHSEGPRPWISEQETAATHLERNLQEIDAMCATGQIAARLQVLVCEPIPAKWTDWMDSMLVNCGGKPAPIDSAKVEKDGNPYESGTAVEDRASPVQVVVVASSKTADTCHDLKSGFMEKRLQDLILAPPYLSSEKDSNANTNDFDPAKKTTHPDLVSSDDHDLYIALKWSSIITVRSVNSFLQASADLAAGAASPNNKGAATVEKNADGVTVPLSSSPSSPFLIPSFVRVSYVSEENNKVAKWRMHGDFFHPAAWEICKDSYDMAWIPDTLSGAGGVNGICYPHDGLESPARKLKDGEECGQWWVYMAEEQMPTSPEVYANEVTSPLVQGGSNYIWMLTERQRREVVKLQVCEHTNSKLNEEEVSKKCGQAAQAVMPLGDLESFLINFTPNTALGKKHNSGRRPGYSREEEHKLDREKVRERKQLKGQEDIEKALFDYTVYPAALFHKDATVKAARARDKVLSKTDGKEKNAVGPQTVKSGYYDVTITKPRQPVWGWCQNIARKGLCTLYADYFRTSNDTRCLESCGMKKDWSKIAK